WVGDCSRLNCGSPGPRATWSAPGSSTRRPGWTCTASWACPRPGSEPASPASSRRRQRRKSMIPGIEPLYQELAESMLASIPEEWSTATFDVLFFSHSTVFEAEYTRQADGLARSFAPPRNGHRAFQRLRQLFKDAGKPLWGRAT